MKNNKNDFGQFVASNFQPLKMNSSFHTEQVKRILSSLQTELEPIVDRHLIKRNQKLIKLYRKRTLRYVDTKGTHHKIDPKKNFDLWYTLMQLYTELEEHAHNLQRIIPTNQLEIDDNLVKLFEESGNDYGYETYRRYKIIVNSGTLHLIKSKG